MKRRQRLAPRSWAPMSELPAPSPAHSHPADVRPLAAASRESSRSWGRGLRSAHPRRRRRRGAGGGEAQGGRGGGKRRPGRGGRGSGRRRGEGRARRAAAPSGGRAGGAGGQAGQGGSQELHEVPPGPRTGRCPGEAVGGSPTPMARRGPRRRARSKSGLRASSEGRGLEVGRVDSRPHRGGRAGLSRVQRRLFRAPWSRQPRAARLRGFFGNLQMFS